MLTSSKNVHKMQKYNNAFDNTLKTRIQSFNLLICWTSIIQNICDLKIDNILMRFVSSWHLKQYLWHICKPQVMKYLHASSKPWLMFIWCVTCCVLASYEIRDKNWFFWLISLITLEQIQPMRADVTFGVWNLSDMMSKQMENKSKLKRFQ